MDLTNHFHKKSRLIHFIRCKSLCISGKKDRIDMHNNFVILQTYNQICLHIVLKIFFSVESIKIWQFKYARCFLFCLRRRLRYLVVANVLSMVYPFSSLVLIFNLHLRICGITEETLQKYS